MNDWSFITADDEELNEALEGRAKGIGYPWPRRPLRRPVGGSEVGVLAEDPGRSGVRRPIALVVSANMTRRLFGRYAQLRSDLSPLSAWCHVLDWDHFEQLHSVTRDASLAGFEAAWIGLTIAETRILADRPLSSIKLAACLATQSYALARCRALWPNEKAEEVLDRYDLCRTLLRTTDRSANKLRGALADIWGPLLAASASQPRGISGSSRALTTALLELQSARLRRTQETAALYEAFSSVPEASFLLRLENTTPEGRVRDFDSLIVAIEALSERERGRQNELLFLAGYLATVAAGGAPSLRLAEKLSGRWPQIVGWAYVIGSIGELATWTSSFDGLGRLVARELSRPLRLNDPPMCDFALEEASALVDRALQDPLVHLRLKQSRVLSAAIYPGVNITVPISEVHQEARPRDVPVAMDKQNSNHLAVLADALWPYFESRFRNMPANPNDPLQRSGRSRGVRRQESLPLPDEPDR